MMDRIENSSDALHNEFRQLSMACSQLQSHPALAQLKNPASLIPSHAGLMLRYADQLDCLFATIHNHAATLKKMAKHDLQAAGISAIACRTVADISSHVRPMIDTLRRKGMELTQAQCGGKLQTAH